MLWIIVDCAERREREPRRVTPATLWPDTHTLDTKRTPLLEEPVKNNCSLINDIEMLKHMNELETIIANGTTDPCYNFNKSMYQF